MHIWRHRHPTWYDTSKSTTFVSHAKLYYSVPLDKNNRIWVWNNVKPSKYWCNFWLNYPLKPPYGVKWAFMWVVAVNGIPSLLNEDSAVCLWSPHMFPWLPRGSADLDLRVYAVIPFLCIFVLPFMRYTSINYIEASFQYICTPCSKLTWQIGISMFYSFNLESQTSSPPPNVIMSISSDEEGNKVYLSKWWMK